MNTTSSASGLRFPSKAEIERLNTPKLKLDRLSGTSPWSARLGSFSSVSR